MFSQSKGVIYMAIFMKDDELLSYSLLNINTKTANTSGTLFVRNDKVFKIFWQDYSERIHYLRTLPPHPSVLPILEEIQFEWNSDFHSGYITEYKKNAKTFLELFVCHLEYQEKERYIKQVFSALKHLHQFIVLGDIHGDNFFAHEGKAYIYDLDFYRKVDEKGKIFKNKYHVAKVERKKATKYTDLIKTYIESYSLLLEEDLSSYILQLGYKNFCHFLMQLPLPKEIIEFINLSLKMIKEKRLFEDMYNPNYFINENILEYKEQVARQLRNL